MSHSKFYMWGERGLVATFFADLHAVGKSGTDKFLAAIEISSGAFPRQAKQITTVIEPDFSNTGFGHPDAIIRLDNPAQSAVLIVEAKRNVYAKACKPPALRGAQGFNSTLNGQLELDYALALALSHYRDGHNALVEPDWILSTPFSQERRRGVRRLKNPAVLRDVVTNFAGLPLENYFYIVLTSDRNNPLSACQKEFLPELYHSDHGFTNNCWLQMKHQFGWINYDSLEKMIRVFNAEGQLSVGSLFLDSMSINRRNMGQSESNFIPLAEPGRADIETTDPGMSATGPVLPPSSRGVSMIFAPKLSRRSFLHFSWRGESCAIRDYSSGAGYSPSPQRGYRTTEVKGFIELEVPVPGREPVEDARYWHAKTIELNLRSFGEGTKVEMGRDTGTHKG